jgi:hypothetical protein
MDLAILIDGTIAVQSLASIACYDPLARIGHAIKALQLESKKRKIR